MTTMVPVVLALIDGMCSGFRSAAGRTGLVRHREQDVRAAARGLLIVVALLIPSAIAIGIDLASHGPKTDRYHAAAEAMLPVLVPYAAIVVAALAVYAVMDWRRKYLAMALVLGPFTLARPAVAIGAGIAGVSSAHDTWTRAAVVLGVLAVLATEPIADRHWAKATSRAAIGDSADTGRGTFVNPRHLEGIPGASAQAPRKSHARTARFR